MNTLLYYPLILLLFLIDLSCSTLFGEYAIQSVRALFIAQILITPRTPPDMTDWSLRIAQTISLLALSLHSFVAYGRFGLELPLALVLVALAGYTKRVLHSEYIAAFVLLVVYTSILTLIQITVLGWTLHPLQQLISLGLTALFLIICMRTR